MKLLTKQQIEEHNAASVRGAIEGTVVSGGFAGGLTWYLNRRWATYRALPLSLKVLGVVIIVAPSLAIQAERRGLEYDKSQWTGPTVEALSHQTSVEKHKWASLGAKEKLLDWVTRHEYSIILGSWALSMAVAGGIIWRNKYQSATQKVVQARMWAQGLTIGLLIGAGALTHRSRAETRRTVNSDHSWALLLEEQEREKEALKVPMPAPSTDI